MIRVAVVQNNPIFGEKEANIAKCQRLMESVKADLYVLPEFFATGYNFLNRQEAINLAEPYVKGITFIRLKYFVEKKKCFVVFGFVENSKNKLYNSAAIIGHDRTKGLYRKIHLYDREKLFFEPGNLGFNVFDTSIGRIGIMICFDWYFPESTRTLALKGAQIIAHPSNLILPYCPESMPVRCRENRIYVATANRIGTEKRNDFSFTYIGQSQLTSPTGNIIKRASAQNEEIILNNIDLSEADQKSINFNNHLFKDRKPEYYSN